jgi:hypothetical protein
VHVTMGAAFLIKFHQLIPQFPRTVGSQSYHAPAFANGIQLTVCEIARRCCSDILFYLS